MMKRITLFALVIVLFLGCSPSRTYEEIETIASEQKAIYSLLVEQNGQPIIQQFFNGKNKNDLVNVQSVTKSIMALLIGIAIEEGKIPSVDEPIHAYFEDIFEKENEAKKAITIQHLMDQTSGLEWEGFTELEGWMKTENPSGYILQKKMTTAAGEVYNYNSAATHLLSPILEKATGKSALEFAYEKLFSPLGIDTVDWKKMNDGYYDASGLNLSMRSEDLQKIAKLLLEKGVFNGKTIISKKYLENVFSKKNKKQAHWGLRNSTYSYCWYSTEFMGEEVHYAMGYGGQYIFIFPNLQATVVANHEHDTPHGIEQSSFFIGNILVPLVKNLKEKK